MMITFWESCEGNGSPNGGITIIMRMRSVVSTLGIVGLAVTAAVSPAVAAPTSAPTSVSTSTSAAASAWLTCANGFVCFYYNSNQQNAAYWTSPRATNFTTQKFDGDNGQYAGHGELVKNNAASMWNDSTRTVRVFYNSNFVGVYDDCAPNAKRNLANTYNENASFNVL
ncbi:peptidase inhibitor family I36 protein [Streptomyces clavifer]|uniref:peptidase inhibitor family I36 protein n=1 Tax=Streptomyces clavifer TaxID=68188 RepID=UPI0036AC6829